MALQFAHGDLAWNSADVATTVYTVSGLPFQPKALCFFIQGLASATDAASQADSARVCLGFATSTSDRRCVGFLSVDTPTAADCQEIYRADAVLATVSAAVAADGLLDLNSITADGFTLIVDDAAPVNLRVFWMAWGGSDIVNAATGEIVEPAATGNQSYSVTNWLPAHGADNVVLFGGCQLTAAAPTVAAQDAGFMFGAATGTGAGNQFVCATNEDDGIGTMDTDRYAQDAECLAMMVVAGGNPDARAQFNGFDAAGFDLDWIARALTNRRYIYLAIQGGAWKVGSTTINIQAVNNTATVSLPFTPAGAIHAAHGIAESTAGTSATFAVLMMGTWSSTTSRRSMGYMSENATTVAEIDLAIDYDSIDAQPSTSGTLATAIDIDAVLDAGFRLIVDTADAGGSTTRFMAFVAFGSVPSTWTQNVQGVRQLQDRQRAQMRAAGARQTLSHWGAPETFVPPEADTWTQPVSGTASLRMMQAAIWAKAAKPHLHEDFNEGPIGDQPDTYQPSVPGVRAMRDRQVEFWRRALRGPYSESEFSFVPEEESPWTQPAVAGVSALRASQRLFWQQAARPALSSSEFSFEPAEPDVWTTFPLPGSRALRLNLMQFWQRAALRPPVGDFENGPLGEQPDTFIQPVVGSAAWVWRRLQPNPLRWRPSDEVFFEVAAAEPEAWTQPIVGAYQLHQRARNFWRQATIATHVISLPPGVDISSVLGHNNLQPYIVVYIWRRDG